MNSTGPCLVAALVAAVVLTTSFVASGAPPPAGAATNKPERPDQGRRNSGRGAALQRDLLAFEALPPERQEALREVDRQLHDAASGPRLARALRRYTAWLDALPEADRHRIESTPDAAARLAIVRGIRQRQWFAHLPRAQREELQRLSGPQRAERIRQLQHNEAQHRHQWR